MNKIYLTEKQITLIKEHLNARVNPDDINDIEYYVNEPEDEDDEPEVTVPEAAAPEASVPFTGDNSNVLVWLSLLIISAMALVILESTKKSRIKR